MAALENKIDFVALISVTNANSNGDPLNGNRPRTDYNGMGEISDVCIKRKIRNRIKRKTACGFIIWVITMRQRSSISARRPAINLRKY